MVLDAARAIGLAMFASGHLRAWIVTVPGHRRDVQNTIPTERRHDHEAAAHHAATISADVHLHQDVSATEKYQEAETATEDGRDRRRLHEEKNCPEMTCSGESLREMIETIAATQETTGMRETEDTQQSELPARRSLDSEIVVRSL